MNRPPHDKGANLNGSRGQLPDGSPGGRVFDLRPDLFSFPTRLDLAYIEAEMLWPDDAAWRERAIKASTVEWMHDNSRFLDREALSWLASLSRDAFPINHVQGEVQKERFLRGWIVGSVLYQLIARLAVNPNTANKQDVIDHCIAPYKKTSKGGMVRITRMHFNNEIWPIFESVAHLWAAYFKSAIVDGRPQFPCTTEHLRKFLADAEFYRIRGEQARTRKSPTTVLQAQKTVKLPALLAVSPSKLEFRPR